MKKSWFAFLVLLAGPAFAQSTPEIAFDSVPDYPKLPPGVNFGEVAPARLSVVVNTYPRAGRRAATPVNMLSDRLGELRVRSR